jgi:peptidoglycan/LPS O-acetylase OafA/YrhL
MAAIAAPLEARAPAAEGVRVEAGYIPAIEGLRGIAVLWVVLFHYVVVRDGLFDDPAIAAIAAVRPLNVIVRNGYLGVDLFFLITGFLLTLPWFLRESTGEAAPSLREFYARRFWRIAPAYYVQLVALFLVVLPLLKGIAYWRSDLYVIAANVAVHAVFLQNTTPLTSGSLNINGALWSLTAEAQYYVLLPLLAPLFVRAPRASLAGAIVIAVAWQLGARHGFDPIVRAQLALGSPWPWTESQVRQLLLTQLPSYFAHFALGILAGRAWVRWRNQPLAGSRGYALQAAAVAALALLYLVYGHLGPVFGEVTWLIAPFAFGTVFIALAASDRAVPHAILGQGPLRFLGRVSYSAYLYHLLVLALWNAFLPPLGWASLPLYLATVFSIAWISWRYVESPFLKARIRPSIASPPRAR